MSRTFVTSRNVTLEFLPIPTLLEKLQAQHKPPDPPTYEIKTATGTIEKHIHDETTLESDADKAAWDEYQKQLNWAQGSLNIALMRLVMLRGVKVAMPDDDAWVKEQEFIGLTPPTDLLERRMYWLETEALASAADYTALLAGVMAASGVSEEVIAQAADTFRGDVRSDSAGGTAAAPNGDTVANEPSV